MKGCAFMSIRKRESKKAKNGYVYEVYFNYTNIFGVPSRYSKSGFITKKQAQEHETDMKKELNENGIIKKEINLTLNEVFDEFMKVGAKQYQPNTIYNTKKDYNYIKKTLGMYRIKDINYSILQNFFNNRENEGIESNKNIKKALKRVFVYAMQNGYITNDPLSYVKLVGKENTREKKIITFDDFNTLIDELHYKNTFRAEAYIIALKLGYYCGLRISEVFALEKKDFDLQNGFVSLNKKLVYYGRKTDDFEVINQMKNKGSKAVLPIAETLKKDLCEWFKINPYDIVVCDESGMYINPAVMYKSIRCIAIKHGIDYNFHMLRHTYSTNLVMNNVNIKTAQELMRHNDINTTLSIYTHVNMEHKKAVLDEVFKSKSVEKVSKTQNTKALN